MSMKRQFKNRPTYDQLTSEKEGWGNDSFLNKWCESE